MLYIAEEGLSVTTDIACKAKKEESGHSACCRIFKKKAPLSAHKEQSESRPPKTPSLTRC